jgi:hypothetical protein
LENKEKNLATFLAHLRKVWWISEKKYGNTGQSNKLLTWIFLPAIVLFHFCLFFAKINEARQLII